MPNPLDFLINPIRRGVGGVRRGIGALEDQLDPTRTQPQPTGADVNPADLARVRAALPPTTPLQLAIPAKCSPPQALPAR